MWVAKFWYRHTDWTISYYDVWLDPSIHIMTQKMDMEQLVALGGQVFSKHQIDGEIDYQWFKEGPTLEDMPVVPPPK